ALLSGPAGRDGRTALDGSRGERRNRRVSGRDAGQERRRVSPGPGRLCGRRAEHAVRHPDRRYLPGDGRAFADPGAGSPGGPGAPRRRSRRSLARRGRRAGTAVGPESGGRPARIGQVGAAEASSPFVRTLESWDGRYEADQRGPVAFEALMHELAQRLYGSADGKVPSSATDWNYLVRYLPQDLSARPEPDRRTLIKAALDAAAVASARYGTWGDIHRLRVGHALAGVPVVGRFFVLDHYAVGGSRNTIMKTAHGLVNGRHDVTFGSQSRQLCDMSDPDRSEFVLLGGEDGWLGSANFADQVELWRQGRTITMPLTAAAVAAQFPTVTRLTPGARR